MLWEKLANFFGLESVATYITALIAAMVTSTVWAYRTRQSKKGRHVVCSESESAFSHLRLSETARELVEVRYLGPDQLDRPKIDTLSELLIDIKNESDTDTLNNIKLKFWVPDAEVLKVWWEQAPSYYVKDARIDFSIDTEALTKAGENPDRPWIVQIALPHLKSFEKYGEYFKFGILADGDLNTIKMLPEGSRGQVSPDQTWTAKYLSYRELQQKAIRTTIMALSFMILMVSALSCGGLLWLTIGLDLRQSAERVAFFFAGFVVAYLVVALLYAIRDARIRASFWGHPIIEHMSNKS